MTKRLLAAAMAIAMAGVVHAATINVPADYATIQAAVDAASNGDEIVVEPGTYTGTGDEVVDMLGKAITLRASGTAEETIIDGEGERRVITCDSVEDANTIIEGFTITGGYGGNGSGIYCDDSSPTITGCTISDNTASLGGGIYCRDDSSPTITDCTITNNTNWNGGGGIYSSGGGPTISGCTISNNNSPGISLGVGNGTITDCMITNNNGTGIYMNGIAATITDCTITNNKGTGINIQRGTITGCTISGNTGVYGGGIDCDGSYITIAGCTITGNTAVYNGGGLVLGDSPTITDCTILDNTAGNGGGGIYCAGGSPTISGCTISNNATTGTSGRGGGIYCGGNWEANPTISGCTISGNTASDDGGGIYCSSSTSPTITDCTISGNTTTNDGGGIWCRDLALLTDTVVCGNAPDNIYGSLTDGGGVCLAYSCQDSDGNGVPDKCDGSVGDGIHEVPSEYATIQEAIEAAGYGDTVLVAPGVYTDSGNWVINPSGKPITIRATGTPEETILDGQGARRVVQCSNNEGADTVIDGFTITGGSADIGGGIYCSGGGPTITGCTIANNTATSYGGGIYCWYSDPTITNCTFSGNTASDDGGGGIYCSNSSPTITGCTISGNTASDDGGGIYCDDSSPTITGCTFSDNTASDKGGGIYCHNNSIPTISNCEISNNTATDGGGIYCYSTGPVLTDTAVCSNLPNQITGTYSDEGGNTVAAICPVPGACCTNGECVIAEQADCLAFHGTWLGEGTTCDDSPCPTSCLGDINEDGEVSTNDLLTVIANWGPCP